MSAQNSFVGVGWNWPIETDQNGAMAVVTGTAALEQAMYLILATNPGDRPMRPEFGARLRQFVFASADATTAGLIASEVRTSLTQWEPRVEIGTITVTNDPEDSAVLLIDIEYAVRSTNDRRNLVFPFYVIPEHDVPGIVPGTLVEERR